jgi:hypothetical protein
VINLVFNFSEKQFHNQHKPIKSLHFMFPPVHQQTRPIRPSLPQPLPLLREDEKEKKNRFFCESPNASMPMNAAKQSKASRRNSTSETQEKAGYQGGNEKKGHKQRVASISKKKKTHLRFLFPFIVNNKIEKEILRQLVLHASPCIVVQKPPSTPFCFVKQVGSQ